MADEQPGILQQMLDKRAEWASQQPSFGAQLEAMLREADKDIRKTVNEVFFGSPELGGEPGTPLNPTPQQVTQDLGNVYGYKDILDSHASRAQVGRDDRGMER